MADIDKHDRDFLLYRNTLDSLEEQLAIVRTSGEIIYVNDAWIRFGRENGLPESQNWFGVNYLDTCWASTQAGDESSVDVLRGITKVFQGAEPGFYFEYPCHSPTVQRWFILRVAPLSGFNRELFVITHQDITLRIRAEQAMKELSLHDSLTQLPNRRHFDVFVEGEWRRCARNRTSLSVLMIDLDNFKAFNDAYGHMSGDQCLVSIADILRSYTGRGTDIAARFGGDEFAVVLGGTDADQAWNIAQLILEKVMRLDLQCPGGTSVGVSIGLASMIPQVHESNDHLLLLQNADAALYQAKAAGKNRVVIFSAE